MAKSKMKCRNCDGTGLEPDRFDILQTSMDMKEEMRYRRIDRLMGRMLIRGRLYYDYASCNICEGRGFVYT